jgi:hypothetical protein
MSFVVRFLVLWVVIRLSFMVEVIWMARFMLVKFLLVRCIGVVIRLDVVFAVLAVGLSVKLKRSLRGLRLLQNGLGLPQHVIVSPPESDWGLAEFHNGEYLAKVKKLLNVRGFVGGCSIFHGFSYADYYESVSKGVLYGWRWHPHVHCIAFLLDGYGKCRRCSKLGRASVATCAGCDGFESVTRRCYVDDKTIVKVKDERITIFGTAWYQLNHSSIKVVF